MTKQITRGLGELVKVCLDISQFSWRETFQHVYGILAAEHDARNLRGCVTTLGKQDHLIACPRFCLARFIIATLQLDWPEQTANVLYEAPLLFATGGIDDSFHIIYIRMASDQLSLKDERLVVTRLLKDHLYALFIFSNKSQDKWHFLNSKPDDKRLIFRRIIVSSAAPPLIIAQNFQPNCRRMSRNVHQRRR